MSYIFSDRHRALLWRRLWIILADEERKLGLAISQKQIRALENAAESVDFERIREIEKKLKHDVMAHLKAFSEKARAGEPILHLGATSAFITDNADALIFREASELLIKKLTSLLEQLGRLMLRYKGLEMTGFTHFQPAQPVTLGKRMALWAQDLVWDLEELQNALARYQPLGCKGTTGTQASFMTLFGSAYTKVRALDRAVCKRMGFSRPVAVSGQTLSRKADTWFLNALSNLGSSLSKMSYDLRLLQHLQHVAEPFGSDQVGSSAMPYKQNPMLSERISGLSRLLMTLSHNGSWTHATQWLERSLDDSSNRRIVLPEAFLTADALLEIAHRILSGLRVRENLIADHLRQYRDIFISESMMMERAMKGESRQKLHEKIRQATLRGNLPTMVASTTTRGALSGAASQQVVDFYKQVLKPAIRKAKADFSRRSEPSRQKLFSATAL